jgi:hypothetical protein
MKRPIKANFKKPLKKTLDPPVILVKDLDIESFALDDFYFMFSYDFLKLSFVDCLARFICFFTDYFVEFNIFSVTTLG